MDKSKLSAEEAKLYDRQIRLWGYESQQKLRAANILLIGMRGLGSEIAKNILLAGINSLTILDDGIVTEDEVITNIFLEESNIGKKIAEEIVCKAQALNPLVKIVADTQPVAEKDLEYFTNFTLVVAIGVNTDLLLKIDKVCREKNVKLICTDVIGHFAYLVSDFNDHKSHDEQVVYLARSQKRGHEGKEKKSTVKYELVLKYPELKKVIVLPNSKQSVDTIKNIRRLNPLFFVMLTLMEFRNKFNRIPDPDHKDTDQKHIKNILHDILQLYEVDPNKIPEEALEYLYGELPPINATFGGTISQEIIKAVSENGVPVYNILIFDPLSFNETEIGIGVTV